MAQLAVDFPTGWPVAELLGAQGTVVYAGTTNAAPISEDQDGTTPIPGGILEVTGQNMIPGFWLQGDPTDELEFISGGYRCPLVSLAGVAETASWAWAEAEQARIAADASALAAQNAEENTRAEVEAQFSNPFSAAARLVQETTAAEVPPLVSQAIASDPTIRDAGVVAVQEAIEDEGGIADSTVAPLTTDEQTDTGAQIASKFDAGWRNAAAPSEAVEVYLASDGDDAWPGVIPSRPKATLGAALAAIGSGRGTVRIKPGDTIDCGASDAFEVDISKVRIIGDSSFLRWTTETTEGYGLWLYSSVTYTSKSQSFGEPLNGVTLLGGSSGNPRSMVGLYIGHDTHPSNAQFRVANGGVMGFTTNVQVDNNAWRVAFDNFNIHWGDVLVEPDRTNTGECMTWRDSMFGGNVTMYMGDGEWHFDGCSHDGSATIVQNGRSQVYCNNDHFETFPEGPQHLFVRILHADAACFIDNSRILWNGERTAPYFEVISSATRGLSLSNVHVKSGSAFRAQQTGGLRAMTALGAGRVQARGVIYEQQGLAMPVADSMNVILNGDAETGSTDPWVVSAGSGDFTVDTATPLSGTGSFLMEAGASGLEVSQEFPVSAGQQVALSVHIQSDEPGNTRIEWIDADGVTMSVDSTQHGTNVDSHVAKGAVVPAGARAARLVIRVSGGGIKRFDRVVVNVLS